MKEMRKLALQNQRGQSAILIALLFNVMFVFFAMAINVALIVHDKINLQNATDLAAYYAASKQAEILNVIAHENYMIRQSWKLAAWRYRVLGTMGMIDNGSVNPAHTGSTTDTLYQGAAAPSLCITYQPNWQEVPPAENLCRHPDVRIPPLPQVKVIAGFLGLNQGIAALSTQLRAQFHDECVKHGAFNWWFAMSLMHAFRLDQRNRMQVITALANDLSGGKDGDFTDLDGLSVKAGAEKTFLKNLTFANAKTFDFQLTNSLEGIDPNVWLPKVTIAPTILYTDIDSSDGCNAINTPIDQLPIEAAARALLQQPWPAGLGATDLFPWISAMDSVLQGSDYQFTLGVEKNPWVMAYMEVNGSSSPREIFYPVAGSVPMTARAFAKPFGGRIGPWYGANWDVGAPTSTGNPTDALVPPRVGANGGGVDPQDQRRLPNYSRYPGDQLGMMSQLAQNEISNVGNFKASFAFYLNIKADFTQGGNNDILAWDGATGPAIRTMELAALAPDLFDISYYSIDADFEKNYLVRLQQNATQLGIDTAQTPIRPDLGFNGTGIPAFAVQDQMSNVQGQALQRPEAFYFVRDRFHLLTDWLPAIGAFNYDATQALQNFGKCKISDDGFKFNNPGSCVAGGGRTGYSTQIVSRDMLMSNQLPLGGNGGTPGAITNPPKDANRGVAGGN